MARKIILFGAGKNGLEALKRYGKDKIAFFCDNDVNKINTLIEDIQVISFDDMVKQYNSNEYVVMVTPDNYIFLVGMLEYSGIDEYVIYQKKKVFNFLEAQKKDEICYSEQNTLLDYYAEKSKRYDLIDDGLLLREDTKEILKKHEEGVTLLHYGIGAEGNFYGNLETLLEYANYLEYDRIFAPNVSHNALKPSKSMETMFDTAAIVSGRYFQDRIHKWRPYLPVFSVGPYIQYAVGIYDKDKVRMLKEKNGKTVTVFLPHSIENISRYYSKKDFIDDVVKKYKGQFDSIYLCVYWADLLEECCDYAIEQGLKVVTAGFRFDKLFTKRLRTIFELSDAISGGDFGTHYMYAITFNIPIARINISDNTSIYDVEFGDETKKRIQLNEQYREYENKFFSMIGTDFMCTEEQKRWLLPYAGIGIKRSKDYIHNVFSISKDIILNCGGELEKYPNAVRMTYKKYIDCGDINKMEILINSTGNYLFY